jgi:hypothetical protein
MSGRRGLSRQVAQATELRTNGLAEPEAEARRLFAFLGEAFEPEVISFDPAQHTATTRYRRFTASRRQASGDTATIYRSRVGAGGASLDPFLRTLLRRRHGALLRELGYPATPRNDDLSAPACRATSMSAVSAAACRWAHPGHRGRARRTSRVIR